MFREFLDDTITKFSDVTIKVTAIQKDVLDTITLFGEDESTKSTDFFAMFYNFAREFCSAYKNLMLNEKVRAE